MANKQMFGIDISRWQGSFDIAKAVKTAGIEFCIIKCGGGDGKKDACYEDSQFRNNYNKCEKIGLHKGCYFFGHAMTLEKAKIEVAAWLDIIRGCRFDFPIVYDVEGSMLNLDRRTLTEIIKYVCSTLEKNGYWAAVYSSSSAFNNRVVDAELLPYTHYVAYWGRSKPKLKSGAETQIWQFGGETNLIRSNKINGQVVDQDYCYVDYPYWIKKKHLNGY